MTPVHLELGNVLTRAMWLQGGIDGRAMSGALSEQTTPTTVYGADPAPVNGCEAVLSALREQHPGPAHEGGGDEGVALIHLNGAPRVAVMGLAGLPTTELTIQGALRQVGSSVVQVRSSDTASLEAQLVDIRAVPLDILAFAAAVPLTAERLLASGGVRPRALPRLLAMYNGPAGEHEAILPVLGDKVEFTALPPLRIASTEIDPIPTELWLAEAADRAVAADPDAAALRQMGFNVAPFARAFTQAAESLAGRSGGPAGDARNAVAGTSGKNGRELSLRPGVALVELGGRYTEIAAVHAAGAMASRWVEDLNDLGLALSAAGGGKGRDSEPEHDIAVEPLGRWIPFEWATTGLADSLANYLRRPFSFPANWRQVLTLMALGRVRLARARSGFRPVKSGTGGPGDWRVATGMYVVSGGYFRNLSGPGLALALALDGLEPVSVSEIWCDRFGLLPYTTMAGQPLPADGSHQLLPRLATVVAPSFLQIDWRRPHEDDLLALVTVEREHGGSTTFRIVPGALTRFPLRNGEAATLTVHPMRENDFGAGPGKVWRGRVVGGLLGLVFDTRGRPIGLPTDAKVRQAKLLEWLNTLEAGRSRWEDDQR